MKDIIVNVYPADYNDWKKIIRLMIRRKNPFLWIGFIGSLFITFTCIPVLFAMLISGPYYNDTSLLIIGGIFFLFIAISINSRIRSIARNSLDSGQEVAEYIINETGFSEKDAHENNFSRWSDFKEAIISKNIIMLSDGNQYVIFLSKNYTAEEFEQIRIWLKEKISIINRTTYN